MKNKKGFTQLVILLIYSLVITSVAVAGGILIKHNKLTASIPESLEKEEIVSSNIETSIKELNEPKKVKKEFNDSLNSIIVETPTIQQNQEPENPTTTELSPTENEALLQQLIQVKEEQTKITTEQDRQAKCLELSKLKERIQELCHSYYFVEPDKCIAIRQKDIEDLKNYVPNDYQRELGQDEAYYASRIQEEQDKVDQLIELKSQYELLKTECNK